MRTYFSEEVGVSTAGSLLISVFTSMLITCTKIIEFKFKDYVRTRGTVVLYRGGLLLIKEQFLVGHTMIIGDAIMLHEQKCYFFGAV